MKADFPGIGGLAFALADAAQGLQARLAGSFEFAQAMGDDNAVFVANRGHVGNGAERHEIEMAFEVGQAGGE